MALCELGEMEQAIDPLTRAAEGAVTNETWWHHLARRRTSSRGSPRDVGALTGHDTTLDGSVDSLELVQEALANMWESGPSREYQRVVQARAVLYVGTVFRQSLGRGQWELCTDPARGDFGHLTIDDWAPSMSVRVIRRTSRPAVLRESVVLEIEARKG